MTSESQLISSVPLNFKPIDVMKLQSAGQMYPSILVNQPSDGSTVFQPNAGENVVLRLKLEDTNAMMHPGFAQAVCSHDGNIIPNHPTPFVSMGLPSVSRERDHEGIHQFECGYCRKVWLTESSLREHVDMAHKGLRRFPCSICGKAYAKAFLLKNHIKSVHERIRDVPCPICQKGFCKKSVMKRHMKSVHSDTKNFQCSLCEKAFTEKKNLQMHIDALHKGLKPYHCQTCGKDFARKCDLFRHSNAVHKESKPFECSLCGKGFPQRWYLDRHTLAVHKSLVSQGCCTNYSHCALQQIPTTVSANSSHHHDVGHQVQLSHQQALSQQTLLQPDHLQVQAYSQHQHEKQLIHRSNQAIQLSAFPHNHPTSVNFVSGSAQFTGLPLPTHGMASSAMLPAIFFQQSVLPAHVTQPHLQLSTCPTLASPHLQTQPHSLPLQVHLQQVSPSLNAAVIQSPSLHQPASDAPKRKQFHCNLCEKVYPRKQSLQAHLIQVHSDTKPYCCKLCGKGFVRRWDFYRHVSAVHRDRAAEALDEGKADEYIAWIRGRRSSADVSWECLNAVRQDFEQQPLPSCEIAPKPRE